MATWLREIYHSVYAALLLLLPSCLASNAFHVMQIGLQTYCDFLFDFASLSPHYVPFLRCKKNWSFNSNSIQLLLFSSPPEMSKSKLLCPVSITLDSPSFGLSRQAVLLFPLFSFFLTYCSFLFLIFVRTEIKSSKGLLLLDFDRTEEWLNVKKLTLKNWSLKKWIYVW